MRETGYKDADCKGTVYTDIDYKTRLHLEDFSPSAIAESGQCFRMTSSAEGVYRVIANRDCLYIYEEGDGDFSFSCEREDFDLSWRAYFDLDADYENYRGIALSEDEYLKTAMFFGKGIRILRQDSFETLISFIISQRKSVPAIRTSVERLCERFGEERTLELRTGKTECYHCFPEPSALLEAGTDELSACGLGYRTPYVRGAAEAVLEGRLEGIGELPTEELLERLMELKGVGLKVASCVALFAYHRLDIAPVDVWMHRVIDAVYGGSWPEEYKPYGGVIQQYLFNYARLTKLKT